MNKNDYRNHLDRIRCSAEFRAKMEKRLSSEPDGEYADSVSDIEYVPKVNYHRWTAFVASLLIVVGISGFAFLSRNDIINNPEASNTTETSSALSSRYNIGISVSGAYSKSDKMDSIGAVPPEYVDRYLNEMKSWNDFKLDGIPSISSEPTGAITLSFTGEDSFTWKIDSNGCAVTIQDGEKTSEYYSDVCYLSLLSWIARDMPYFDWTCIIDGDKGDEIDTLFKNHIDEIEVTGNSDDYDDKNSIRFFDCGSFSGIIYENGDFRIYYDNEQNFVSFKSSPEFYNEISNITTNNLADIIAENDIMFYSNSTGQTGDSVGFRNVNMDALCSVVENTHWTASESDYPSGEFFGIGNLVIHRDGSIYNSETGFMYTPVNQDNSEIINAVEEIIKSNNLNYISYLIASADNRFDNLSGKISYSNNEFISGTGEFLYDNKNNNEYVYIEDYNSNSAELTVNEGYWTLNTTKDNVTETSEDYSIMTKSVLDYESIRSRVLDYLNRVSIGKDTNRIEDYTVVNTCDVSVDDGSYSFTIDIEYQKYHTSVNATIDSIGNIVDLTIQEHDLTLQTPDEITFTLGDGNGGGIVYNNSVIDD